MPTDQRRRLEALEQQLRLGWSRLRFDSSLECQFREQYRAWSIPFRLALITVASALVAITPLLDQFVLLPPEPFAVAAHRVQLGFMLPILLLAGTCALSPSLRRLSDATSLLAVAAVVAGLLYQRHLGARYGVWVPTELITATLAGGYVMGGLGFRRTSIVAIGVVVATASNEIVSYGNTPASQYLMFGVATQFVVAALAGYLQEHFARGTWLRNELLEILADHDGMTGLLNFRAFNQRYRQQVSQAARDGKPLVAVMLDLDCFKLYNDTYGHLEGNEALKRVAALMNEHFRRESDIRARTGGEEFTLVLYNIGRTEASRRLEALREAIVAQGIEHARSTVHERVVTASIGAHWFIPRGTDAGDAALRRADRALYKAKEEGRNRVVFSDVLADERGTLDGLAPLQLAQ